MKNLAASIQDRLKNRSRESGMPLNRLLEDFAIARLFARLSDSDYSEKFILKGAQLFTLWANEPHRPTRDADFLSYGAPDTEVLESVFNDICALQTEPLDGLEWMPGKAAPIREDNLYGGVRIKLFALLGRMRIPVQIDVGFGDAITPAPKTSEWPMPLDFPPAPLLVYCPETTIAEKLHAAEILGTANSRMKDFFDLFWLCKNRDFDGGELHDALRATFERRSTALPVSAPSAFTEAFYSLPDKQNQWAAFLRKSRLDPLELQEVCEQIACFLGPAMAGVVGGKRWLPN
ncbi:MAG: nucleotidyl transferase AbiEii/AbiGii toxin family protein, partial [Verrucomicrobiales bacterium]